MDQIKIGKFIAACRKKENMTQLQLAEKLDITDRAVSKWETGRAMPDAALMLELCAILHINVNDLLCGEVNTMDHYDKELEKKLIEILRQKEESDRQLLMLEKVIGILSSLVLFIPVLCAALIPMENWMRAILIVVGFLCSFVGFFFALRIEQTAGYYECQACKHRYKPTYKAVTLAPHLGTTRQMRCPECGKKTWQKKVISKD